MQHAQPTAQIKMKGYSLYEPHYAVFIRWHLLCIRLYVHGMAHLGVDVVVAVLADARSIA